MPRRNDSITFPMNAPFRTNESLNCNRLQSLIPILFLLPDANYSDDEFKLTKQITHHCHAKYA